MINRTPPKLPRKLDVRPGEESSYHFMLKRIEGAKQAKVGVIGGEPYAANYFMALANTPVLAEGLARLGQAAMEVPGGEHTFSHADHELIDAVIAFDSGFNWLMAGHATLAVQAGVRLEALEAIRGKREEDLTEEERLQVSFIRAVRDGSMTQEIWLAMWERLGSERGTIEYAFFVLLVQFNHLLAHAMGIPDITKPEMDELIGKLQRGDFSVSYKDYSKTFGDASFDTGK